MNFSKPSSQKSSKASAKKSLKSKSMVSVLGIKTGPRFNKFTAIALAVVLSVTGIYLVSRGHAAAPPPPAGGYFALKPVGAWTTLPTDSSCASQVHHSAWEPRVDNSIANQTVPTGVSLRPWPAGSTLSQYNTWMLPRVTGNFKGTTDEIVQWAACKWGWPDDVIRAQMVVESNWFQNLRDTQGRTISGSGFGDYATIAADCPPGYSPASAYIVGGLVKSGCPRSFGVLQATWKDGNGSFGNFPAVQDSTAFNIDFVAGTLRACYEGMETWLTQSGPGVYAAGDMWGCIGRWYSGDWHSADANNYIASVQNALSAKIWLGWPDQSSPTSTTADTTPPSTPTNLTSTSQTTSSINLSWSPSSDNIGVTAYDVYRNNAKLATTATTSYSDTGLSTSASYSYSVLARDAAGNSSPASIALAAATQAPAPITTDPTAPSVTITTPVIGARIGRSVTVNATSTDNVKVTKLEVWFDGSLKCSTTSSSVSCGINTRKTVAGTHTITVKAFDAAGNVGQGGVTVYK